MTTSDEATTLPADAVIVAKAGRYFRNARYLMVLMCLGLGGWFGYDGWVGYPKQNQEARARGEEESKLQHKGENEPIISGAMKGLDIPLQKLLAIGVPVIGVFILVRMLHRSRGEYRLDGTTLHVPGHPPVPLENIRQIDKTLWDKKGIALITYDVPGSTAQQTLTLDDFVYQQKPTDAILERIEAAVSPEAEAGAEEPA